ncbi:MAG: glycosyltransferase family 4 protein [Gammaproteobacteria bacterium]
MNQLANTNSRRTLSTVVATDVLGWDVLKGRKIVEDTNTNPCFNQNEQQAYCPDKCVEWPPNGIDVENFVSGNGHAFRTKNGIPQNRKVILCVGQIDPRRNQLALLSAMQELLRMHDDSHLILVGPVTVESYGMMLLKKMHEASLYDNVTIIPGLSGGSSELVDAYHAADIFCLPSWHESSEIVVLGAWASGLPVITSNVGDIHSFTRDGTDVLHANPSEPETFRAAIDKLLIDRKLARHIADNGRYKAWTQFDWSQFSDRFESVYRDMLKT